RQARHADADVEWDKATAESTKAIELKPDNWETWSGRALVHFHRRKWADAIVDFSKAIDLAPDIHTTWWHRGHAHLNLAQWDKAAANFTKVVEQWPDGSEDWYWRGVALANVNQPDQALADFRQAFSKGFRNVEWMKTDPRLNALRARADFGELVREFEKSRYLQLVADCSRALERAPDAQSRARLYRQLGFAHSWLHQYGEALADWQHSVEAAPVSAETHNNLAWLLATCPDTTLRNPDRAVAVATKAVELEPVQGTYWNTLGVARYRAADWPGAVEALNKSIELRHGGDSHDWFFLALAEWQRGNKE